MYSLTQLSRRLLFGYLAALIGVALLLEVGILYPRQMDYVGRLQSMAIGAYRQYLQQKSEALLTVTEDYAYWDESYAYVLKPNSEYLATAITPYTVDTLKIHGILITDRQHKILTSYAKDPGINTRVPFNQLIPESLFQPGSQQGEKSQAGWFRSERGTFLVTVAPIRPTNKQGAAVGFLYFFRHYPDSKLIELGYLQGLDITLESFTQPPVGAAPLLAGEPDDFKIANRHYRYLNTLNNEPSTLITIDHRMQPVPPLMTLHRLLLFTGMALFPFLGMLLYRRLLIKPIIHAISEVGRQDAQGLPVLMTHEPKTEDFEQLVTSYNQLVKSVREHQEKLQNLASTDGLTGLLNRRSFDRSLLNAGQRSERLQQPLCLVLLDIDYFKAYNDHYGHLAGDEVLRQLATLLRQQFCRATDRVGRFGGEEFIVLMEAFPVEQVRPHLELLLQALQILGIEHKHSECAAVVSVSIGAIHYTPGTDLRHNLTPDRLIAAADKNLYQAKGNGRNQVVITEWQSCEPTPPQPQPNV